MVIRKTDLQVWVWGNKSLSFKMFCLGFFSSFFSFYKKSLFFSPHPSLLPLFPGFSLYFFFLYFTLLCFPVFSSPSFPFAEWSGIGVPLVAVQHNCLIENTGPLFHMRLHSLSPFNFFCNSFPPPTLRITEAEILVLKTPNVENCKTVFVPFFFFFK